MPQKVTLAGGGTTAEVVVSRAVLEDDVVRLEGADPSCFPSEMADDIQFASKRLTALIYPEASVRVESVAPTDEPITQAEPTF